jgi:hypothetical protein
VFKIIKHICRILIKLETCSSGDELGVEMEERRRGEKEWNLEGKRKRLD